MPRRNVSIPVSAPRPAAPRPTWLRPLLKALTALLLMSWFSGEIRDTDIWLHLKTGQHTLETRALTVPDPFSYTSSLSSAAYPGEAKTRYFNLTSEWLAQILMYGIYTATGFPGLVLLRALLLVVFCWLVGLMAFWRTHGFYRSLGAAIAAGGVAVNFQQSRPFLITFVLLALTMAVLERRRWLWALPPVFAFWANCHGGFFLGWLMLGAYCADALIHALIQGLRKKPVEGDRRLWLVAAASILASGFNPNGFRILEILLNYHSSPMQSTNLEWQHTAFWLPSGYSFVLFGALLLMLAAFRRTRPVDWFLYIGFGVLSVMAVRNNILMGLVCPVLMAAYLPDFRRAIPAAAEFAAAAAVALGIALAIHRGAFQLRTAEWQLPSGASDFLQIHQVTDRMFNTYANGGYLVWRLWPAQRDFIDPRGLSEQAYADYGRILFNADSAGGKTGAELLEQYAIQVLVLDGFDRFSGRVYLLAAALADPKQTEWKLVQSDAKSVVFMRQPPPGVSPLNSLEALHSIELQCRQQVEHDPERPRCAQGLSDLYTQIGDMGRARQWMSYYLDHR